MKYQSVCIAVKDVTLSKIFYQDLDGHIIEVGENIEIVVKRFLDSGMSME